MTIVHRNKSKKSANTKNSNYASIVASLPAVPVASSVALQNSFSALHEETSDSDSQMKLEQIEWKQTTNTSDMDVSDEINDSEEDHLENGVINMETDIDDDNVEESQEESQNESTDTSEDSATSEEEIVVNEKRYQRVRQPWCKDGVPRVITSIVTLLAFAYFMQFVFYMCGFVNDDCESPAGLLRYSKARRF